ncbi:ROK family protein, partial [Bacteroidota bacterium]
IAIDLGGTKCAGAIVNESGEVLTKVKDELAGKKGKEVGTLIRTQVNHLKSYCIDHGLDITGIGVSVPGISNKNSGKVWAPNIPGWQEYGLTEELESAFGNTNILVDVDSDRACTILGEVWKGSARECKNAIFLAIGTGIGAGILIDGQVLQGSQGIAGAIGWWALDGPYRSEYAQFGDFEYHASGDGIIRVARNYCDEIKSDLINHETIDQLSAREIFDFYKQKDPVAVKTIDQAIMYWGKTIANLVSLFNPEKIIFGGGVFGPGTQFLDNIYMEALKWAQPIAINQVQLIGAKLGNDAALLGACKLILDQTKLK